MIDLFLVCALGLSTPSFKPTVAYENARFTEADRTFFRMMKSMVPDHGEGQKMILLNHVDIRQANRVRPGGFAMVRGPFGLVNEYFRNRHWELVPFMWREYQIYRKPNRGMGGAA